MSTYPLTILEQARVLRPAAPARPGRRRHQAVVVWNLDGTLTHRDTLLPFLRQVCGPLKVSRAVAAAAGRRLARTGHDGAKALLLEQLLGGLATVEVDAVARRYAQDLLTERLRGLLAPVAVAPGRTEICPPTVICSTLPTSPSGYARYCVSMR